MKAVTCLVALHDPWLLALAALLCAAGSWVTIGLFARFQTGGGRAGAWLFLAGTSAGATTWCTHFVAMLAFDPGGTASFAPLPTALSLLVAAGGSTAAFALAREGASRPLTLTGGAALGLSVTAMHYVGMAGYSNGGVIAWDLGYVAVSAACSLAFGALSLLFATGSRRLVPSALLVLAIVSLHFVGIGALDVSAPRWSAGNADAHVVALAVAAVGTMVVGAAFFSNVLDARHLRETAASMERLAMTDTLTGLPNRACFAARLDAEIEARREAGRILVLGIDLDRFKEINDLRGHAAGDAALRTVAQRMASALKPGEFIARLGGDEFAAFRPLDEDDDLADMPRRLREAISPAIRLPDGSEASVGGSFGGTVFPDDARDSETLLGNADLAMYRAKSMPSESQVFYSPEMDESVRARRQMVADLRLALAHGQFELHYQVQKAVETKSVTGHEALLRWRHPVRGLVPPSEFIPAAEETGLIVQIGEWVIRQACRDAADRPGLRRVAVNMSAVQFVHPDLPGLIADALRETGLDPSRLEVELTESTLVSDPERNLSILRRIQDMGVSVAMDDFGTGYSSLSTLRSFRFDKIKLDRSFMREVESDPQAKAIIRAVLALGDSLSIPVLAEGVETPDQLAFLQEEGCTEAQGYLLGRPLPLEGKPGVHEAA